MADPAPFDVAAVLDRRWLDWDTGRRGPLAAAAWRSADRRFVHRLEIRYALTNGDRAAIADYLARRDAAGPDSATRPAATWTRHHRRSAHRLAWAATLNQVVGHLTSWRYPVRPGPRR